MNPFEQQASIPGIKKIIAVGSGKGGVGKSTLAVNLAASMAQTGAKVGLLDADLYGPSIPRMTGTMHQRPEINAAQKLQPIYRHSLALMSMGHLVEEGQAVIWRGPMLFKAMEQFFRDVAWGELDYLFIDLPPGTGDVVLTMAQKVPVDGGIVVCTPQNVALADAKKAIDMFEKVNIRCLGVIENMCDLFPRGEIDAFLDSKKIPKLASIPFGKDVALASEVGIPAVLTDPTSPQALAIAKIVQQL